MLNMSGYYQYKDEIYIQKYVVKRLRNYNEKGAIQEAGSKTGKQDKGIKARQKDYDKREKARRKEERKKDKETEKS